MTLIGHSNGVRTFRLIMRIAGVLVLAVVACSRAAGLERPALIRTVSADTTGFIPAVYTATGGTRLPYRLLAPEPAVPGRRYPLVVQFHGSGALGSDNQAQLGPFATGWGTPATRARFPAYVLVPQFPSRTVAYRPDEAASGALVSDPLPPLAAALELVDSLRRALPVDTTRVYTIGFSMGGSSVWHALLARPMMFAGAMSIAGVPPDAAGVRRLPDVPLLLLHGTADPENPYAGARRAYEALLLAERRTIEFRTYPGLGHAIPPDVLADLWWREWLFRQHR